MKVSHYSTIALLDKSEVVSTRFLEEDVRFQYVHLLNIHESFSSDTLFGYNILPLSNMEVS